ncbi:MAG TPA: peptidoglycan DD-metalloendopeptidase family protein [Gaiellaceae bacterium]|nr:peptidoglycan DD-metalloendopeptidase family protein [Gaiellaceae bacterium]
MTTSRHALNPRRLVALVLAAAALAAPSTASAYGWPVKPFHSQHPVRGFFGDPRIGMTPEGRHSSFHFGVDVSAPNGSPVYATADGEVVLESFRPETVAVLLDDGRTELQYWHVVPAVRDGQRVEAFRTVVGHVKAPWAHVHFSEVRDGAYRNPLRPGGLEPFIDRTRPLVRNLRAERNGAVTAGTVLNGSLDLVVEARDRTPLEVPAPWTGKPVTPAVVRWRLVSHGGTAVVGWLTVVDFRRGIPGEETFTSVYARWTRQNHASVTGRYRFYLAHSWDSSTVHDGAYRLQVCAEDAAGNRSVTSFPVRVGNGRTVAAVDVSDPPVEGRARTGSRRGRG